MSSMTKVMQKLRDEQAAADPSVVADDLPESNSAFVVGAAAAATLDPTTVAWEASRIDPSVIMFHDRYSAVCERYRAVRARLLTMNADAGSQAIAVTSGVPEEGKSVTTANLGLVMAEGGDLRIVIVDADFRRRSIARMLSLENGPGFAEVLRREAQLTDVLRPTPFPNLKILPAGEVANNAYGELLGGPHTSAVMDELRASFDYIFMDTTPVTTVSDVSLLAPFCDGALIVIEMNRTPEPTVQQAVQTLQANNVKILGAILSRFADRGARSYDPYYSYYYNAKR